MVFLLSIVIGTVGAWVVGRYGGRLGLIDVPKERSSHLFPTPRGGGIGLLMVFITASISQSISLFFWIPLSAISLLAFFGDRIELSPKRRLFFQFFLIICLVIGSTEISLEFNFSLVWVLFWAIYIVGTANFFNFMDGINGIAGISGTCAFALLSLFIYRLEGESPYFILTVCIALACLGFLPFNMPFARVFMGDVGSILLGSVYSALVYIYSLSWLDFLCLASFLFPFYLDELTTMIVRIKNRENLTQAHRNHFYQLLANEKKIPHWQISLGFGLIQLFIGLSISWLMQYGPWLVLTALVFYIVLSILTTASLRHSLSSNIQ
jgi:Fuc2NAc and GlcNAc transferase